MKPGGAACTTSGTSASSPSASTSNSKHLTIAYLSFAVENSYDAPMLAAAEAVASDNNATLKVFDANNSPQTQYSQLQDVITSGQYDGIILQPIFGTGLTSLARTARGSRPSARSWPASSPRIAANC